MSLSLHSIAFSDNNLQRLSQLRQDGCVATARQAGAHRFIIFSRGMPVMKNEQFLLTPNEAQIFSPSWSEVVLLGYEAQNSCRGSVLAAETMCDIPAPFQSVDMRALYSNSTMGKENLGEKGNLGILAQAASLLSWHKNNQFCARCGAKTRMRGGGVRRSCDNCGAEHFPRTDPVGIMLVYHQQRCLLARNVNFPERRLSCLAGFIEQGETFEDAVRREVAEEVGLKIGKVSYIASQPWPFPHSLMLGAFAQALDDNIIIDGYEIVQADWFTHADITAMMADNHPQGLTLPPSGSIAHFLIRSFVEGASLTAPSRIL